MRIKEMFQNRVSSWVRYSEYTIIQTEKGEMVTPAPDAIMSIYDPVDGIEELVSDVLNWGKELNGNQSHDFINEVVLKFAKKYGLLGWITALPVNKFIDANDEEIYVGHASSLLNSKATIKTQEYIDWFTNEKSNSQEMKIAFSIGRPDIYDTVFSKQYCEPVIWTVAVLNNLYTQFYCARKMNADELTSDERIVFESKVKEMIGQGLSYEMRISPTLKMYWIFDSLKTIIEIMFFHHVSEEDSPLKICKFCGKAYYNSDKRSEFCSPQCRNKWNVYKSRAKKKES